MTYEILPDGRLKVSATGAEREDATEASDAFDTMLANSELQRICPSDTGDLTAAPMIGILGGEVRLPAPTNGFVFSSQIGRDNVWYQPILFRWAYMQYQLSDMFEELAREGSVTLDGGVMITQEEADRYESAQNNQPTTTVKQFPATTASTRFGSRYRLQYAYASLEEFQAFNEVYNILGRIDQRAGGWCENAEQLWNENPVVQSSSYPGDLRSSDMSDVVALVRRLGEMRVSGTDSTAQLERIIDEAQGLCMVLDDCQLDEACIGDAVRLVSVLGTVRVLDGEWVNSAGQRIDEPDMDDAGNFIFRIENDEAVSKYHDVIADCRSFVKGVGE